MERKKSIKRNMVMNFILTVSNTVFPLITYTYVARVLTPTGTGKIAFVDSILAYFLFIASLGIPAYGRREVAKVRDDKEQLSQLVYELFVFNTVSTVVSYVFMWVIVISIPEFRGYTMLFIIMGGQIILKLLGMEWLYEGLEEYSYITIRSLIFKIIAVILTFILIHDSDDIIWYGFVHVFTASASYLCNFLNIKKYVLLRGIKGLKCNLKRHVKPILMLFSASLAITIYANFDVSMLGIIGTENEVGLYSAALKIQTLVISASTAVTAVLVPRMAYYFYKKEKERITELLSKSLRVSLLIAVPVSLYIFIFSENVLAFIGGNEYISASNILRVLMLCMVALVITNLCGGQLLIPIGREKRYTQSVLTGLFINLGLNFLLIPSMGAIGAALGTLVTEIWNVIWMGSGCSDYLGGILKKISILSYFIPMSVAGMLSLIASRAVLNMNVFWQLAFTSAVYFCLYYGALFLLKEPMMNSIITRTKQRRNNSHKIWRGNI